MSKNLQNHTVSAFDQEIKNIASRLEAMSNLFIDSINVFIEGNKVCDVTILDKVREHDDNINQLDKEVESLSTSLIALRNPLAVDLRYVISSIKISTIIERQGDMMESIIKKIIRIDSHVKEPFLAMMEEVSLDLIEMSKHSIKGFNKHDITNANKVWRLEDKVDNICYSIIQLIKEKIAENPKDIDQYVSLILITRSLERIGDYCTKITKAVHYVQSGKRVSEGEF